MEEQLSPLAVTHLLQHTLRSLCGHDDAQWVYAVFWRILPRNYPPPKWDLQGGIYDRTRGNRRNWILAWEDGFCNFAASACDHEGAAAPAAAAAYTECAAAQEAKQGLQPELFFKMSHDIYNYGEGLIGKVAADHSHKWVFQEAQQQQENEINLVSSWSNPADSHPRTWEAQFQSGIKTIALIAVREGVVQLGSMKKVAEDLSYVVMLRRKFGYLESIPGVLLPHPSSAAFPAAGCAAVIGGPADAAAACGWPPGLVPTPMDLYDPYGQAAAAAAAAAQMHIVPSMSSLEALLSKLPSVDPAAAGSLAATMMAKDEADAAERGECHGGAADVAAGCGGEGTSVAAAAATTTTAAAAPYYINVAKPSEGF
ncbi:hypothetical protein SEVIR_1G323000v4 [Setaria viridis]|uniref:Transcription factor MYC/MYB N-terminal domain-containing protein n=1 Tax=Setaria viridis TaxID=4556 RepID=A0A4U6WFD0_SETVI|nr:protein RICE SALT SENSITIVE 3-like [Setaria viridis]TKW41540.1 hypothetical protein SEVIR_1G323000v2 [Setaria viridis]